MKKRFDKRLDVARRMPLKKKKPNPDAVYRVSKDEVVAWLSEQPALLMYLSDVLTRNGIIKYDPETGAWKGVDYDDD